MLKQLSISDKLCFFYFLLITESCCFQKQFSTIITEHSKSSH